MGRPQTGPDNQAPPEPEEFEANPPMEYMSVPWEQTPAETERPEPGPTT